MSDLDGGEVYSSSANPSGVMPRPLHNPEFTDAVTGRSCCTMISTALDSRKADALIPETFRSSRSRAELPPHMKANSKTPSGQSRAVPLSRKSLISNLSFLNHHGRDTPGIRQGKQLLDYHHEACRQ